VCAFHQPGGKQIERSVISSFQVAGSQTWSPEGGRMHRSIWPFQFGLPRDIKLPEAETTKEQTILKRIEPAFIEPMQCKPVAALPAGEQWTFEIKLDGYRCIAVKRGREVTLFSRHKKVLTRRFSSVVDALVSLRGDFVLDGELVAFDPQGRPSFQLLQNSLSRDVSVYFYAFDLLNQNGDLLVNLPFSAGASYWSLPPQGSAAPVKG
jgi:ATP-dependent DNA ligase